MNEFPPFLLPHRHEVTYDLLVNISRYSLLKNFFEVFDIVDYICFKTLASIFVLLFIFSLRLCILLLLFFCSCGYNCHFEGTQVCISSLNLSPVFLIFDGHFHLHVSLSFKAFNRLPAKFSESTSIFMV